MTRPRPTRPTGSAGSAVEDHDDFGGLHRDTSHQYDRRRALQLMVGVGVAGLVSACSSGSGGQAAVTTTTASVAAGGPSPTGGSAGSGAGAAIPDETAGPFPADGSNGPNVLTDGAVVRTDLTTSFGDHRGTAEGVPLTVQLTVVDAATGQPRSGAAVYLWHCTADGRYSLYEVEDQNYLRGVQVADDAGRISFTTVYPGCYSGRWPHCHFEVYGSLADADAGSGAVKTSQLALPEADSATVYADARYADSAGSLAGLSLDSDGVFADGWTDQLATVAGSVADGMTASLLVRV